MFDWNLTTDLLCGKIYSAMCALFFPPVLDQTDIDPALVPSEKHLTAKRTTEDAHHRT